MNTRDAANGLTVLGQTNFRYERKIFGIKRTDRRAHMDLIGKTGTGKSTLIRNLACQDLANGEGFALLDPHGDLVEQVLKAVPEEQHSDLIYFNVPDRRTRVPSIRWKQRRLVTGPWLNPASSASSRNSGLNFGDPGWSTS